MSRRRKTAGQQVSNWTTRTAQAGGTWQAGVASYNGQSPGTLAAAKSQQAVTNYSKALGGGAGGMWAQSMQAPNFMANWKSQCALPGMAARFNAGAQKGTAKYTRFATNAQPVYAGMKAASNAAAAGGPIARVSAALQVLIDAGRKGGGTAFG